MLSLTVLCLILRKRMVGYVLNGTDGRSDSRIKNLARVVVNVVP